MEKAPSTKKFDVCHRRSTCLVNMIMAVSKLESAQKGKSIGGI